MRRAWLLMAAAALITGCVSQQTYQAEVKKSNTYQALSEQLQTEVKSDQVEIKQEQNQIKLTMVDTLLFAEGGWQIHKKGEETLDKIVPTLKAVKSGRIVVEGYTDNVPIGPALRSRFASNWELSTARATDVLRYLAEKGVSRTCSLQKASVTVARLRRTTRRRAGRRTAGSRS